MLSIKKYIYTAQTIIAWQPLCRLDGPNSLTLVGVPSKETCVIIIFIIIIIINIILLLPLPPKVERGYVFIPVCLSDYLFVCL